MAPEGSRQRYRSWYAVLLRFYPKQYRERFAEQMEQTFDDLLRERGGKRLFSHVLTIFIDTSAAIVRERFKEARMKHRSIIYLAFATAFLLLIPRIAMQFPSGVKWDIFDFIFAGTMIFGTGLLFELARKKAGGSWPYKLGAALALAAAFLLIWINAAVGIIGDENNPLNLMYLVVIGIAIVGTVVARFHPHGMARALFAAAIAQACVPVIALLENSHVVSAEPPGVVGVFVLNFFFAVLFAGSALLFRRARATRTS